MMKKLILLLTLLAASLGYAQSWPNAEHLCPGTQGDVGLRRLKAGVLGATTCDYTTSGVNVTSSGNFAATAFATAVIPNASSTGTSVGLLAKLTGAPSTAVNAGTGDTTSGAVIGITIGELGTTLTAAAITGNAVIATAGIAACTFDAATTAGDYVGVSAATAGNCTDLGATIPTTGVQVLGRVLATLGSAGNANVYLNSVDFAVPGGANPAGTVYTTGAAYTNATTTFSSVTGLSLAVLASRNYKLDCMITWQGSANTAGPKYQWTGPASPTSVTASMHSDVTVSTYLESTVTALSTPMANTGTVTATTNFTDHVTIGFLNGTTAGTLQLQAAANGAGTLTIQPGSYCSTN